MTAFNAILSRSFVSVLLTLAVARAAGSDTNLPPPVQLSAQADHQRLMGLLHITLLRKPKPANYEESKANPHPDLPDPLTLNNGEKVTTASMWWNQRRPEIVEDFDREIYGRMPKVTPKVTWEVVDVTNCIVTHANSSFPVVEKQLLGRVDNSAYPNISVAIQLSLTLPANTAGPSPVIMVLTGRGGFSGEIEPWQAIALSNG